MVYLYEEPDQVVFMDSESYEQLALPKSVLEGRLDLMTLNMQVEVVYIDGTRSTWSCRLSWISRSSTLPPACGVIPCPGLQSGTLESGATVQVPCSSSLVMSFGGYAYSEYVTRA